MYRDKTNIEYRTHQTLRLWLNGYMHLLLLRNQLKPIRIETWREKCRKKAIGTSLKDLYDLPEDDLYNWYNLYIYRLWICRWLSFSQRVVTPRGRCRPAWLRATWWFWSGSVDTWACLGGWWPGFEKRWVVAYVLKKTSSKDTVGKRCQRRCDTIHNVEQRNKETHIFMMVQNEVNPTVNQPSDQASKTVIF